MTTQPINLSELSSDELRDFFDSFDTVLVDNDGVLSFCGELTPGAQDFVAKLRAHRKQFHIVTNNNVFRREYIANAFTTQGLQCHEDEIITPALAVVQHLKSIEFKGKMWVFGGEGLEHEIQQAGFELTQPDCCTTNEVSDAVKALLKDEENIQGILLDLHFNLNYLSIAKAVRLLQSKPEILWIQAGTEYCLPLGRGQFMIGAGYIQDIIHKETGRAAVKLCKPHKDFGDFIFAKLKCTPSRTLFVGDSLPTDMGFAKKMGYKQLLVLTGCATFQEMNECDENTKPQYYVNNLTEFNALLSKCNL